MKKTVSIATLLFFIMSMYLLPSVSAITLGEIQPDKQSSDTAKKIDDVDNTNVKKKGEKKAEQIPEKNEYPDKKDEKRDEVNPRLVCLLSVLMPGGGHFYLNNDVKGIGFCLAAGVGYTATGFFMIKTMLSDTGSVAYKNYLFLTGFLFFITIVVHFVGIIEAYSDADEMNKERLFSNEGNDPYITEIVLK